MSVYLEGTFAIQALSFPFVLCLCASCYLQLEGPSPSTGKARNSYSLKSTRRILWAGKEGAGRVQLIRLRIQRGRAKAEPGVRGTETVQGFLAGFGGYAFQNQKSP